MKLAVRILAVLVILTLVLLIFFPAGGASKADAIPTACLSNVKRLGLAMQLYASDNDGRVCLEHWIDPLHPYVKEWGPFECPLVYSTHRDTTNLPTYPKPRFSGYALNVAVIGKPLAALDPSLALIFETDAIALDVVANINAISYRHERRGQRLGSVVNVDARAKLRPAP